MDGHHAGHTHGNRRARSVTRRLLIVLCLGVLTLGASDGLAASPGGGVRLTASTADVTGLAYEGATSVSTAGGDVQALRLVAGSATFTGLEMRTDGSPGLVTAATGGTTRASDLVLLATRVDAVLDGVAVSWTTDSPPPAEPVPGGSGTLTDLVVQGVLVSAGTLVVPGAHQTPTG